MHAESDIKSVYNFLKDTPEGPLRKMMVGGDMADVHFRVMMKIAKGCSEAEFLEHFNAESMPKIRLAANEMTLKETLWPIAKRKWMELGLLGPAQESKAAA